MKLEKIIALLIFIVGLISIAMYFILCRSIHVVKFDSNGGSSVSKQFVKDNELVIEPNIPIKDGYRFNGWYLEDKKYDFRIAVTNDITLLAQWELEE